MSDTEKRNAEVQLDQLADAAEDTREIDLLELFYRLIEKSVWIVLAALIGAIAFGSYSQFFVEPTYRSTAKLYVVNTNDTAINLTDLNLGEKVADDFVQVFKNRDVYDQVVIRMEEDYAVKLPYSFDELQSMMNISVIDNTRILRISVSSLSAVEAEQIATAYAETAKEFITAVMGMKEPADFERARLGERNPQNTIRNALLGFVLGAVAASLVIIVLFIVDDRVRTAEQLQKQLNLATLGMMPVQETERTSKRTVRREQK